MDLVQAELAIVSRREQLILAQMMLRTGILGEENLMEYVLPYFMVAAIPGRAGMPPFGMSNHIMMLALSGLLVMLTFHVHRRQGMQKTWCLTGAPILLRRF